MNRRTLGVVVFALGALPGAIAAAKDPLTIEDGVLDEIHLKIAKIASGVPVVLRPSSTEGADLGTGGEDAKNEQRAEATMTLSKTGPELLAGAFQAELSAGRAFGELLPADTTSVPEGALVVEGRFTRIDPGSRAKRYLVGFGAGKSGVQVAGTVKDAQGNVLAEFTHMKHSGIGVGGGDYLKFLSDDAKDVGKDLAKFLTRWATGKDLTKDKG